MGELALAAEAARSVFASLAPGIASPGRELDVWPEYPGGPLAVVATADLTAFWPGRSA